MNAIAESSVVPRTAVEQLRQCADWLEAHGCTECGGVYSSTFGLPLICLSGIEEMRRLFPGVKATKKRESSRYYYTLTADGIRFTATEWIEESVKCEPTDVVL